MELTKLLDQKVGEKKYVLMKNLNKALKFSITLITSEIKSKNL